MDDEDDICTWGWSDETFGFDQCGAPAVATVFVIKDDPSRVCASCAAEIRRLFPDLN
jgi:predicted nucleic acid-binding Zn ribbon protein